MAEVASMPVAGRWHPVVREVGVVVLLLGLWQAVVTVGLRRDAGAVSRGLDIWRAERWLHLPSEQSVQAAALHSHRLTLFLSGWYVGLHFLAVAVVLVVLWRSDRAYYVRWRRWLAIATAVCFVVQLVPVAPPRLLPLPGLVDVAALLGVSEYGSGRVGVYGSMPSVHVLWALLVGVAVWQKAGAGFGRRVVAVAYPLTTVAAVIVTGNHTWADCLVSALVVVAVSRLRWVRSA